MGDFCFALSGLSLWGFADHGFRSASPVVIAVAPFQGYELRVSDDMRIDMMSSGSEERLPRVSHTTGFAALHLWLLLLRPFRAGVKAGVRE